MIKEITRYEIPECVSVIKESFLTVADSLGFTAENAPRFTAFATTEERLIYQLETERRPMYAYHNAQGSIIGYFSLCFSDNGECELNNLCVVPGYRHEGIGAELLEDAYIRAAQAGCTKMKIGIVEENTMLRSWYEQNGFIHTGTKKFDFFPFTCGYMERTIGTK